MPLVVENFFPEGSDVLFCYVDEAGCTGTWVGDGSAAQPALVIAGLLIQQRFVIDISKAYIDLKREYLPGIFDGLSLREAVENEVKGANLRKLIRKRQLRAKPELKFIDGVLGLLEQFDVRILATLWPKTLGREFLGQAVYSKSTQELHQSLQTLLSSLGEQGQVIADSRNPQLNSVIASSVMSQRLKKGGDPFSCLLEVPVFANSQNHLMLQMADIMASTLLWPMCTQAFMAEEKSQFIRRQDRIIWLRHVSRIRKLAGISPGDLRGFHVNGQGRHIETMLWPKPHAAKK